MDIDIFIKSCKDFSSADISKFSQLIRDGLLMVKSKQELAAILSCPVYTIKRWASGDSLPNQLVQTAVVKHLQTVAECRKSASR